MLLIAFPSFAADENNAKEIPGAEEVTVTEEIPVEVSEDAEGSDEKDIQKETAEGDAEGEPENEDSTGDADAGEEKAEETPQQPLRAVLKASSGEKVSYTAKRVGSNAGETSVFSVTSDGTSYTGACAEQGVSMKTSGKATITKIGNGTKIAKVIYYYAIALGDNNWWTSSHKTDKVGKILGMSNAGDTDVTKRRMIECFCQIYNMGSSNWYNTVTSSSGGGWSTNTADRVRDYYRDIDTSNISVPAGFEIWFANADSSAQSFIMWAYKPDGYVTMKKVSGNTSITN